jgi:hypothetical protein
MLFHPEHSIMHFDYLYMISGYLSVKVPAHGAEIKNAGYVARVPKVNEKKGCP